MQAQYRRFVDSQNLFVKCNLCEQSVAIAKFSEHLSSGHQRNIKHLCIWCLKYSWKPGDQSNFVHRFGCMMNRLTFTQKTKDDEWAKERDSLVDMLARREEQCRKLEDQYSKVIDEKETLYKKLLHEKDVLYRKVVEEKDTLFQLLTKKEELLWQRESDLRKKSETIDNLVDMLARRGCTVNLQSL